MNTQERDVLVGPIDFIEPVKTLYPMLRLFHTHGNYLLYDAKSHFACVVKATDLDVLTRFLAGQPLEDGFSRGAAAENHGQDRLWRQLERLRAMGALTPGPLEQIAEVDAETLARAIGYYEDNILTRKFCLEVTQTCNFRCRYCPYTVETAGRIHAPVRMSLETATKAIDYYFERYTRLFSRVSESKREDVLERAAPLLSWYGGEPLLRFDLIRASSDYFDQRPWTPNQRRRIRYSLTTNFSIFSHSIAKFLTSRRVLLYVSLDGPETEHDKNRVFVDGRGTFQTVYRNLQKLKDYDPDYFRSCVVLQSVAASNVDVPACADFFRHQADRSSGSLGIGRYRPSAVSKRGFVVPEAEEESEQLEGSFSDGITSFARQLAAATDIQSLDAARSASTRFNGQFGQLRSFFGISTSPRPATNRRRSMITCPMGFDQLYVAADGQYHMCQLTDGTVGIGHVSRGLDHSVIQQRYLDYNASWNNSECRSCWIVNFCSLCAAVLSRDGGFHRPGKSECDYLRRSSEQAMCNYLSLCDRPELLNAVRAEVAASYRGKVDIQRLDR